MKFEATALMFAAQCGHTETLNAFIEAGADLNLRNMVTVSIQYSGKLW